MQQQQTSQQQHSGGDYGGHGRTRSSSEAHHSHQHRSKSTNHNNSHYQNNSTNQDNGYSTCNNPGGQATQASSGAPSKTKQSSYHHSSQQRSHSINKTSTTGGGATKESSGGHHHSSSHGHSNSTSHNTNAVGHYILGKALGEGTFGKVKLGTHVLTGEKVAVKVLEKSKIKDKKDVERISREIKILKQLHHPNVVQIYEIIETDKDLYLVMEYASGGELFDLIVQNQKLREKTACKYLQEMLAGVHYIHQLGICHRDLKPENLLIDFDGQLKVVDFGLSNMYDRGQTLKTACGSPCYAAPEMIAGNRYHGLKSDIWSVGVVLYAMLCGYLPFEDQKTSNLYKKILNADYTLPKFLSDSAKDIVSKIFITDPNKRISIEELRQHSWYKIHQPENQNFNCHKQSRSVNEKLVLKMESSLGFSVDSVRYAVLNNKHNHLSATYYLLHKKYAQINHKQGKTTSTSSSQPRHQSIHQGSSQQQPEERKSTMTNSEVKTSSKVANNSSIISDNDPFNQSTLSTKYNKMRQRKINENDQDRLKAPVQDQLVLKNHRREQSANATAGRTNRNGDWGHVEDERRVESYERAPVGDDYEMIVSKMKPHTGGEERYGRDGQTTDGPQRSQFVSPSPDIVPRGRQPSVPSKPTSSAQTTMTQAQKQKIANDLKQPLGSLNISNMKAKYASNQTPSQSQQNSKAPSKSLVKSVVVPQNPSKSSTTGTQDRKTTLVPHTKQPSSSTPQHLQSQGQHRKTKSVMADVNRSVNQSTIESQGRSQGKNIQTDKKSTIEHQPEKAKFSQTQKIPTQSKPQQRSHSTTAHNKNSTQQRNQTSNISALISNLNLLTQKTNFDSVGVRKQGSSHSGVNHGKPTESNTAGIEGNNLRSETHVNVNNPEKMYTTSQHNVAQKPVIYDFNSSSILQKFEANGPSDSYKKSACQQRGQNNSMMDQQVPLGVITGLSPTNQQQKVRNQSMLQDYSLVPDLAQAGVNNYQTLQTVELGPDQSTNEIKIPTNPSQGVTKQIFFGTQNISSKMANLRNDPQIQEATKALQAKSTVVSNNRYQSINNTSKETLNDSLKQSHITSAGPSYRAGSTTRSSTVANQPKTSQTTKHVRHASMIQTHQSHQPSKITTKSSTKMSSYNQNKEVSSKIQVVQRENNQAGIQGYVIPTQSNSGVNGTSRNTNQHLISLRGGTNESSSNKIRAHTNQSMVNKGNISLGQSTEKLKQTHHYSKQHSLNASMQISGSLTSKRKDNPQKTRSYSVTGSGSQKYQNHTPATNRKSGQSASQSLTSSSHPQNAHYRNSTASSQNKERRSQQFQYHSGNTTGTHSNQVNNMQGNQSTKQRSASSTNYTSSFLVKSIDGRDVNREASVQGPHSSLQQYKSNQKSSRQVNNSAILYSMPPEKHMYQSISHTNNEKGQSNAGDDLFQASLLNKSKPHSNTAVYNKRKQQVESIQQMLNATESLRQSHNMKGQTRTTQEDLVNPITLQQNNFFLGNGSMNQQSSSKTKPVMAQDLNLNLKQMLMNTNSLKKIDSSPGGYLAHQQNLLNQSINATAQNSNKQSYATSYKHLNSVDQSFLQRSQNQTTVVSSNPQFSNTQTNSHQSYLSDLFKQRQNSQTGYQQNQQLSINTAHQVAQPSGKTLQVDMISPSRQAQQQQHISHQFNQSQPLYSKGNSNGSNLLDSQNLVFNNTGGHATIQAQMNQIQQASNLMNQVTNQITQSYQQQHYPSQSTGYHHGYQQQLPVTSAPMNNNFMFSQNPGHPTSQPSVPQPSVPAPTAAPTHLYSSGGHSGSTNANFAVQNMQHMQATNYNTSNMFYPSQSQAENM